MYSFPNLEIPFSITGSWEDSQCGHLQPLCGVTGWSFYLQKTKRTLCILRPAYTNWSEQTSHCWESTVGNHHPWEVNHHWNFTSPVELEDRNWSCHIPIGLVIKKTTYSRDLTAQTNHWQTNNRLSQWGQRTPAGKSYPGKTISDGDEETGVDSGTGPSEVDWRDTVAAPADCSPIKGWNRQVKRRPWSSL